MVKVTPPKSGFDPSKIIMEQEDHVANQKLTKEDLHKYVRPDIWPITDELIAPSMPEGSNALKLLTIQTRDFEWKAIDRHVKALRVSKSEWLRHAIYKLMQEEQEYFLKNRKG